VAAVIATAGVILAALYILLWYQKVATGPAPHTLAEPAADMNLREKFVVAPLIAAFVVLGFYPKPVIDLLEPAVRTTLETVGVSDPPPSGTAEQGGEG
jgi:NADH-quinone oxidoreductase subunit M